MNEQKCKKCGGRIINDECENYMLQLREERRLQAIADAEKESARESVDDYFEEWEKEAAANKK